MKRQKIHFPWFGFLALLTLVYILGTLFIVKQFLPAREILGTTTIPRQIEKKYENQPLVISFRVPILLYHYVEYVKDKGDTIRKSLNINPNTLDAQIKTLVDNGFTFMTASELADVLDGKQKLPDKPIILTFDDGHWDLYTDVLPILKKYNIHATAYIVSGFIGGRDYLSQDQLTKVIQSGLVEIGAHTVHHISLTKKLAPVVNYEISHSKESLERTNHINIVSFAYPNGSFDQQAIDVVKKLGFRTAVSTLPGIVQIEANRYFLHRLRPGYRTGEKLLQYLEQSTFSPW